MIALRILVRLFLFALGQADEEADSGPRTKRPSEVAAFLALPLLVLCVLTSCTSPCGQGGQVGPGPSDPNPPDPAGVGAGAGGGDGDTASPAFEKCPASRWVCRGPVSDCRQQGGNPQVRGHCVAAYGTGSNEYEAQYKALVDCAEQLSYLYPFWICPDPDGLKCEKAN